jgi:hypothetical protein
MKALFFQAAHVGKRQDYEKSTATKKVLKSHVYFSDSSFAPGDPGGGPGGELFGLPVTSRH